MRIIHQGTIIQSSFALVDNEDNIVQVWNISPEPKEDPLRIVNLNSEEAFQNARVKLQSIKANLQKSIADIT